MNDSQPTDSLPTNVANLRRTVAQVAVAGAGDLLVFIFAVLAALASFRGESAEVYYFPRLVSVLLLVFALANLVVHFRRPAAAPPLSMALCRRLFPAVFIIVVYIYVCDIVGFYWSALPAFVLLSVCYHPHPFDKRQWFLLGVATAVVMGGVYILFDLILQVQTPEPFWVD